MARIKLTAGRVADFKCSTGNQPFLWDSDSPGLAVKATIGGAKSYIHQSKLNGKDIRITIGSVKSWEISGARQESRKIQTMFDSGIDPREVKSENAIQHEERKIRNKSLSDKLLILGMSTFKKTLRKFVTLVVKGISMIIIACLRLVESSVKGVQG